MYILSNALKNLFRNKGRNILLAIIMIAILSCTAVAIIINNTSEGIIEDYKNKFGSEVFIQINPQKQKQLLAGDGEYDSSDFNISNDVYEKLAQSDYVKNTVMSSSFGGYSDTVKALDQEDNSSNGGDTDVSVMGTNGGQSSDDYKQPNLNILGGLTPAGAKEFENETRKIVEGKFAEKDGEAVISQEFAKLNNLKVGDAMKIKNPNDSEKSATLDLVISGIYFDGAKSKDIGIKHPMFNRKNEIITTYNTLKQYSDKEKDAAVSVDAKYYLKNHDLVDAFNEEAHEKGLSGIYDVSVDSKSYNNIVKPVEGLKGISTTFMTIVLIFGGSILVLISVLATRERKYEIGVLRAMGMKKGKAALGLVFETLVMIIFSLIIGLGIGSVFAQPASNMLLSNQLKVQDAMNNTNSFMTFTVGAEEQTAKLESIDAFLTGEAIITIACIALLLGIISVSIGILYINRYEPRKILTERN